MFPSFFTCGVKWAKLPPLTTSGAQNHIKQCLQKQSVICKELYPYKLSLLLNQLEENCFNLSFYNYHFRKFQGPWAHTVKCFHNIFNGKVVGDDSKNKRRTVFQSTFNKATLWVCHGTQVCLVKVLQPLFLQWWVKFSEFSDPTNNIQTSRKIWNTFSVLNSLKEIDVKIKMIL